MLTDTNLSFGLEGLDNSIAEMLFVNPTISADDALRISKRIKNASALDVSEITSALYNNLNNSIKVFHDDFNRDSGEKDLLQQQIKEKLKDWTRLFRKPDICEILKLLEYLHLPLSGFPELEIKSPAFLNDILNLYVINQEDYISKLSLAYYTHLLKNKSGGTGIIDLPKTTLLVSGPTGVGKSLSIQVLSKLFGRPSATVHCNSLVSEGIIGSSISDVFTEIYIKSKRDLTQVEQACIHFDEFDKLFKSDSGVYNSRIINELLNIIDDNGEVIFMSDFGKYSEQIKVSTCNMLFIFSGVFENIPKIVEKRLNPEINKVGFSTVQRTSQSGLDLYKYATHDDYLEAGVKPEIMGRINLLTSVSGLNKNAIVKILLSKANSPLKPFQNFFQCHGKMLNISENGAEMIAEHVIKNQLGARGIKLVLNNLLSDTMFNLDIPTGEIIIDIPFIKHKLKL